MIRVLTHYDLDFAGSLVELAGWNQLPVDRARLLSSEPEGCFLIEHENVPAGTATTTTYGSDLAWIGMILIHPEFRRKGLATALMNRCLAYLLAEKDIQCVKLDATPDGMKVYEKLGFQAEFELSRWRGGSLNGERLKVPDVDFALIRSLDITGFGADRVGYLKRLAGDSRFGRFSECGYGLVRPGRICRYLGPVVSNSPEFARELIPELLKSTESGDVFWDIPEANTDAVCLAKELGFERVRRLIRMWTGDRNAAGSQKMQWAIGAPETG